MLQEGRTDIIRSCSVESVEFGKVLSDKTADSGEKFAAMKKALAAHSNYAKMVRSCILFITFFTYQYLLYIRLSKAEV